MGLLQQSGQFEKTVETIENEQDDVGYDYPYELYTDPYNDEIDGECSEQE